MTDFPLLVTRPVPADFASLHFLLADGCFNDDVPFNPAVYFFGDEVLTSVRAFAAGYRLFHPHRVLGWHAYNRETRVTHWADHEGYEFGTSIPCGAATLFRRAGHLAAVVAGSRTMSTSRWWWIDGRIG